MKATLLCVMLCLAVNALPAETQQGGSPARAAINKVRSAQQRPAARAPRQEARPPAIASATHVEPKLAAALPRPRVHVPTYADVLTPAQKEILDRRAETLGLARTDYVRLLLPDEKATLDLLLANPPSEAPVIAR